MTKEGLAILQRASPAEKKMVWEKDMKEAPPKFQALSLNSAIAIDFCFLPLKVPPRKKLRRSL